MTGEKAEMTDHREGTYQLKLVTGYHKIKIKNKHLIFFKKKEKKDFTGYNP